MIFVTLVMSYSELTNKCYSNNNCIHFVVHVMTLKPRKVRGFCNELWLPTPVCRETALTAGTAVLVAKREQFPYCGITFSAAPIKQNDNIKIIRC